MRTDKKNSNPVGLLLVLDTIKIGRLARLLQLCPTLCNPIDLTCWTPLSMGFSRQEYWSGLLCPPLGDLPNPGID